MLGLSRLRIGLLSSSASSIGGGGSFSPLSLFASGEQGAWYDPSDLSTMFQDTAGTTPVTATGQTVGLLLDKSRGATTPFGPELVTNGDFSTNTDGWTATNATLSVVAAQLVVTNSAAAFGGASQAIPVTVGRTYTVSGANFSSTGTSNANIGSSLNGGDYGNIGGAQVWSRTFVATGPTVFISLRCVDAIAGRTAIFDTISLKEWTGNHATQATAASRPIYGIEPFGGRRNLLTQTETGVGWNADSTTFATGLPGVDGSTNGSFSFSNGTTNYPRAGLEVTSGVQVTCSAWLWVTAGSVTVRPAAFYSGAWQLLGSGDLTITSIPQRFTWTYTPASNTSFGSGFALRVIYSGGTGTVRVSGAQLELGSTATPYQRVTDQWNVTQAGVPSVSYIQCDGTDDFLLTGTITPGIDKAQVFAGVRKLSGAPSILLETSTSISTNNGAIAVYTQDPSLSYSFSSKGTVQIGADASGFNAPITNVLTGLGDIAGDRTTLRLNGTQVAQSTLDPGTGNYLAYPLYIGRRAGTSLPFNGRIYQMLVRFGANLSAATITQTETFVNSRTGAY